MVPRGCAVLTRLFLVFPPLFVVAAEETGAPDEAKATAPADGESAKEETVFERPRFSTLRQDEDWSGLKDVDPETLTDPLDRLKYLRLGSLDLGPARDGDIWASLGGQARLRHETWSDFGFGGAGDRDDSLLLTRLRMHLDLHLTEYVRGFIEGKSALSTDRDLPPGTRRTLDTDELDLQNGFVDLRAPLGELGHLTVRSGRQELLFGKQRLISPLDWSNSRRTFDGFSSILDSRNLRLSAFYTQFVPVRKYDFNQPDPQSEFFGLYATNRFPNAHLEADAYLLGLLRDAAATGSGFNGSTGPEDRYTVGGRVGGEWKATRLDYDLEGAYQFGEVGSGDIDAFMVAAEMGYRPDVEVMREYSFRIHGGFGYASGDESAGGDVNTFNQLFPLGHAYLGYTDTIGRQNVIDAKGGLTFQPIEKTTVALDVHYFWRAERSDALYNAGGGVVRAGNLGRSRDVGAEIDLLVKHALSARLLGFVGYSHFFAGDFIEESGSDSDIDFLYLGAQYTF